MQHRHGFAALAALPTATLTAAVCLRPAFAARWAEQVSRPTLGALASLTRRLPFALLEWGLLACALALLAAVCFQWGRSGMRAALALLWRHALNFVLAMALSFSVLWLPLYHLPAQPAGVATDAQLTAACEKLIADINASQADFSLSPSDLPAKRIDFPFWMRAFGITGFFSFPTGEALISPELPDCAIPFVAVHESMHAQGYAGEGVANIAAWKDCLERGGLYADSARIWGLKYTMGALYARDHQAYAACRRQMSANTASLYRSIGGGAHCDATHPRMQAAFTALGVGECASDYEILAFYLASCVPV